jgi:crotonobetainyl-CoA:carnitine CoA-transferase CaiB-like acyl-CoA transferase
LAGLRVVELGGHTAAALCTRLLADLGADVIKVELPRGDDARFTVPVLSDGSAFLWHSWNVGKRSVVLNLARPEGSAMLDALLAGSDVFVENLAADSLRSLGLAPETVLANHSHLVYCAVSGFGATGSQRDRRAYDTVLQAFAGIMAVTGLPDRRPVKVGPSIVDNLSALCAAVAVLGALHRRRRTGQGGLADVALLDVAYWVMAEWWPQVASGRPATRMGNRRPDQPLENSYRCADGVEVAVSADEPQLRSAAAALFGRPGLDSAWDALVAQYASTVDSATFLAQCRAHGIPASRHHDIAAVAAHPVVRRRSMLVPLTVAGGDTCVIIGTPFTWHDGRRSGPARWHAPRLGEHTDEVLREVRGDPELRQREAEHEGAQR